MSLPLRKLSETLILCWLVISFVPVVAADEPSDSISIDRSVEPRELAPIVRYAVDPFDAEYYLTQAQPDSEATVANEPERSRVDAVAARRRRSTYRLPSMFGDLFGGSILQATLQPPVIEFTQTVNDNVGGVDLFVTNANGGFGADPNPAVVIDVRNGGPMGQLLASSIGPGVIVDQALLYPISDPTLSGFSAPQAEEPGTIVYGGGNAFFPNLTNPGPVNNGEGWGMQFTHFFTPDPIAVNLPSGGGAVRRVKIAENNSPQPRDRFIFNYNFFNNVIGGIGDVNRYAFGFERTFLDQSSSIQVLFPFASTLAAQQVAGGAIAKDTEFGDISLVLKTLLIEQDDFLIAAGLGLTVPTGSDARVVGPGGQQLIHVDHQAVHLLPYVAALRGYDSGWYWQSFVQLDIDVNGNPVRADLTGVNLQPVGVLQEQALMFVDIGGGYWLTNPEERGAPAVAATAELHYTTTLQAADTVTAGNLNIRNVTNRYDMLNLTMGLNILASESLSLRPAVVVPLTQGDNNQFDFEVMFQMNYWR